jgi:hypothetical protein
MKGEIDMEILAVGQEDPAKAGAQNVCAPW